MYESITITMQGVISEGPGFGCVRLLAASSPASVPLLMVVSKQQQQQQQAQTSTAGAGLCVPSCCPGLCLTMRSPQKKKKRPWCEEENRPERTPASEGSGCRTGVGRCKNAALRVFSVFKVLLLLLVKELPDVVVRTLDPESLGRCKQLNVGKIDHPSVGSLHSHCVNNSGRHILTCFSDSRSRVAISMRRNRVRYMLPANSRSSSSSCVLVNAVRMRLLDSSSSIAYVWDRSVERVGEGLAEGMVGGVLADAPAAAPATTLLPLVSDSTGRTARYGAYRSGVFSHRYSLR
uniref:Uncharacterized protein n=1 Tax=Anopheles coluzzii TaxID=1518534 RepID=A0A8W7PM54_ANOCL